MARIQIVDEHLHQLENTAFFFGQTDDMLEKGRKGKDLCSAIKAIQEKVMVEPEFIAFNPQVVGLVSQKAFDEALEIYERNQATCDQFVESMKEEELKTYLTSLESWFCLIVEPRPKDIIDVPAWRQREEKKFIEGVSAYCLPTLRKYITPDTSTNAKVQRQLNWEEARPSS